jgi:hypothetical protein
MSTTIKMKAPDAGFSLTHLGVTYAADRKAVVDAPPELVSVFESHGCVAMGELTEGRGETPTAPTDEVDLLNRAGLFELARRLNVAATPRHSNTQLAQLCRDDIAARRGAPIEIDETRPADEVVREPTAGDQSPLEAAAAEAGAPPAGEPEPAATSEAALAEAAQAPAPIDP